MYHQYQVNRSGPNSIKTCRGLTVCQNFFIFSYALLNCFIVLFARDVVPLEPQLRFMCLQHVYLLLQKKPMLQHFLVLFLAYAHFNKSSTWNWWFLYTKLYMKLQQKLLRKKIASASPNIGGWGMKICFFSKSES